MPGGLTLRSTAFLVALAFGLTFGIRVLFGGGSSAAEPSRTQSAARSAAEAPGAQPDLRLAAAGAVPALREPRLTRKVHDRKRAHQPKPTVREPVDAPPEKTPAAGTPAASVSPTPSAAPRDIPRPPPDITPAPKPRATPAPSSTPASGEFDTSGEP
jgi:hypothetical protein